MRFSSLLLGLLLVAGCTTATKLNYPRVLLPIFEQISVNFTLEVVEKGCFKWTSSRLDLIKITPVYDSPNEDCSHRVVVSVVDREHRRSTAIVWAEDLTTSEMLRCDVILDVIDQLGVLTTTRELYLEEAPETFELWALDAQGNAFTTLEGIEFNWRIVSHRAAELQPKDWNQVLTFLPFSESSFHAVPKSIEKLERAGLQGSMVLLIGVNTGSARVTATLPYIDYVHVPSVEVDIMVLANLVLSPSDVYIMPGDTVEFKVLQLKQGKFHEISLNSQYYLESEDGKLATITGNVAKGLKQGRTSVMLRDHNVPHGRNSDDQATKDLLPKAFITIAEPKKLTISLLPHHNWVTVEGESHTIALDLFTADDHQITVGPEYSIQSSFDDALFYPLRRTNNGSRIEGETVASGSSTVTGTFDGLTAKADLIILKRLTIDPPEVIIPYDPSLRRQKAQFTATGGDGCFIWSSSDKSLVAIGQTGLAETRLESLKDSVQRSTDATARVTQIRAALTLNSKIFVDAQVILLPPIKIEIVRYNIETVLADYVQVHVALWAEHNGTLKAFTSCENLNFELEFSNQILLLDTAKNSAADVLADNACRVLHLKASAVGQTSLKVTYRYFDKVLSDQVSLNVFEKLNILNPVENEVVLPIGASRNLIYQHGPEKLYNSEAELQKRVIFDSKNLAVDQIESGFSKDKHILNVLCKKIGSFDLKLEVFNILNAPNVVPYITEIATKVYCVKPRFVNLFATDKVKTSCPLGRRNSMMHVKSENDDQLIVDIEVLDVQNRKLANISSLLLEWEFTLASREQVLDQASYEQKTETDLFEGVEIPKRDFLRTKLPDVRDNFKVKTIVTQYRSEVLKVYSIKPESPHFGVQKAAGEPLVKPVIENELNFLSVNKTLLPYEHITLFLSRSNVEHIEIAQGSGFYDMKISDSGIVAVEYNNARRHLAITPKRVGDVKLEIVDQCLSTESSYLHISVVTIGRITLHAPDRVEKTKSIDAIARIYDSNDRLLELQSSNLEIYEFSHKVNNPNVLSVALGSQVGLAKGEVRYTVTGMELGETKIAVNSGTGQKQISSSPVPVQVFPPLTLFPRNATIIVGSFLQVYSKGGPSPDTNIIYSVQHGEIISIDSGIAYGLKIGRSKITGRCVGTSPTTGAEIVFSEDTVYIHVVPLDAVEIRTPLNRIRSGAVMPAHVWGVPNISPMVLGTLDLVKIYWSTDHEDVLDVRSVFQEAGIRYTEKDSIGVRVKTLAPGKATLHVTLVTASGQKLSARTEITVFRVLELESPKAIRYDSILVPPRTSVQMKSNLDDTVYQLEEGGSSIVQVSKDGLLKSGDAVGRAQIVASSFDQSLTVPVEVKNIHYILTSLEPSSVKMRYQGNVIPQGMNMRLKVSLHDNLGNQFSSAIEEVGSLKHKLSTKGNVLITSGANYSIGLELIRETSDMLLISLKDKTGVKYGEDYVKLVVGMTSTVFPDETVFSVGDLVCFESPLHGSDTDWNSSDNNLVQIDPVNGVARIMSPRRGAADNGKVYITHGNQRSVGLRFAIDVLEADEVEFIQSYGVFNGGKYRAPLVIKNHDQLTKTANVIGQNVTTCSEFMEHTFSDLYSCKLLSRQNPSSSILKHFKTVPGFDTTIGAYTCDIIPLTSIEEVTNFVKSKEVIIDLEVRRTGTTATDMMAMKIVPAFIVEPEAISIEQVGSQPITISGIDGVLKSLEVKSSDPSMLEVFLTQKEPGAVQYNLRLLKSYSLDTSEDLFVGVTSTNTQQDVKVRIQSPLVMRKCSSQPLYNMPSMFLSYVSQFGLVISALIVLAATVWVFVFCFPQRHKMVNPNETLVYSPFLSDNNLSSYNNATRMHGSPLDQRNSSNVSPMRTSIYGGRGNVTPRSEFNASSSSGTPVYGDATLLSPEKRVHRRML